MSKHLTIKQAKRIITGDPLSESEKKFLDELNIRQAIKAGRNETLTLMGLARAIKDSLGDKEELRVLITYLEKYVQ